MDGRNINIPWGKDTISLNLPKEWLIEAILEPAKVSFIANVSGEVSRSLKNPVESPRISELAHKGMKVALVIDDDSRPTPVGAIAPAVVDELKSAGVESSDITVIPALGVHRAMQDEEIIKRLGPAAGSGIRWEHHDCDDPGKLCYLGKTRRGTPVFVNRTVAQADLVISVGCIEPHIIASFGGGYKNIIPGVAGRKTIAHNHTLNCTPATYNMVGQRIEKNPMRLDLEEGAMMLKPRVFIVNAVLNHLLQIVKIVAGDPVLAHRLGAQHSAAIYGARFRQETDIVITDSHPMNQDLRQGVKALANTVRALKKGGVLLTLAKADEGLGVFGLANRKLPVGRDAIKTLTPLLLKLVPYLKLKGMGEEDRFFLYFALQAMQRGTLLLYAPNIPVEVHERLPFVHFVPSVDAAISRAKGIFPGRARVSIFPMGGITYPNFQD